MVRGDKETIGQSLGNGQQMPLPQLQRKMSKPASKLLALLSPIVACRSGGYRSSLKCGVPMSPASTTDVEMRDNITRGKGGEDVTTSYESDS